MTHSEAVAKRIDARIAELKTEIQKHERALAALQEIDGRTSARASAGSGARSRRAATRASAPTGARSRRATTRESASNGTPPEDQTDKPRGGRRGASTEAVFEALKSGEDQATKIAHQFGVSPAVVRNRLAQLEEAGRVSRTGNRRSTRWRSHAA
jgi:predicted Rossmann fold nucleotide-binding protein DprA/Smf involved in DNA uptake